MLNEDQVPFYREHPGTIKVAGATAPKGSGRCAFHYLQKSNLPIDFMVIGANANQQATKAMSIFRFMVEHAPEFQSLSVSFQPFLYRTLTHDETGEHSKSITVWRTVIFETPKQNEQSTSRSKGI